MLKMIKFACRDPVVMAEYPVNTKASLMGQFELPEGYAPGKFSKPLTIVVQHCANFSSYALSAQAARKNPCHTSSRSWMAGHSPSAASMEH